eukprot:2650602-Pleurochrysis_carterae.AAC.2
MKKQLRHTHINGRACIIGGTRKPSTKRPTSRHYSHYGKCMASDFCDMPTSSPFGFDYILCFYDLATKYLEVCYLRNASDADSVKSSFKPSSLTITALPLGHVVTWFADNGSKFFEKKLDSFPRQFLIRHSPQHFTIRRSIPLSAYGVSSYALVAYVWQQPTSANGFGSGQSIRSLPPTTRWLREALLQLRARRPTR